MMLPEFGPQQPGRPDKPVIDPHDLASLRHPDNRSPLFAQHMLHAAYMSLASAGIGGDNKLLQSSRDFIFEDRAAFDLMETRVRLEIADSLAAAGLDPEKENMQVRCLHRLVACNASTRERHMYVEVLSQCSKSVLAQMGTAQVFSTGPVALHVYSPDCRSPGRIVRKQLVSEQAFIEGLQGVVDDALSGREAVFSRSWAWRWALDSLRRSAEFKEELQGGSSSDLGHLSMRLEVHAGPPLRLRLDLNVGSLACNVSLQHDGDRQEPKIFTYISRG